MTSAELRRVFSNLPDEFKQALLERNAEHGTDFYILVKQAEAEDLAAGYVPKTVMAMVRTMLDWQDQDRRNAARITPDARDIRRPRRARKRAEAPTP